MRKVSFAIEISETFEKCVKTVGKNLVFKSQTLGMYGCRFCVFEYYSRE